MKGKARFKPYQAGIYREWFAKNIKDIVDVAENIRLSCFDPKGYRIKDRDNISNYIQSFQKKYLEKQWMSDNEITPDKFLEDYDKIMEYLTEYNGAFNVIDVFDNWAVIEYGKVRLVIFDHQTYLDIELDKDLSNIKLNELKKISAIEGSSPMSMIIPGNDISVNDLKEIEAGINGQMNGLVAEIETVKNAKSEELAKAQKDIENMMKLIEDKKAELERKKSDMMLELNKRKAELDAQLFEMKKKITILEDTIYTIRCYLGETIELFQIRDGIPAKKDTPLVAFQKMRYLDDELAKLISVYDVDGDSYKMVEKLLKYNDTAFEYFCPSDKCITFIKVARDNRTFYQEPGSNMLQKFSYLHGEKIGFLLRNGDKLFCGWTDEEKIKLHEDVFLKAGFSQSSAAEGEYDLSEGETASFSNTTYEVSSSRVFIFAVLQGLLENSEVLELPESVNVFLPSPYLVYSYAENWLVERKFGDFDSLVHNLNRLTKTDDMLLIIQNLYEPDQKSYGGERGRANAERNRTHDCSVKDGLNKLNLIDEEGNYYISVEKENGRRYWGESTGARANFRVETNEFINITYFNTEWLRYYITNQEIGRKKVTFAHFVRYLKIALDYIKIREEEERKLITAYYSDIDHIPDWVVVLSHWKILKGVRAINEYQAKRFAKYLNEGNISYVKNLYVIIGKPYNTVERYHLTKIEGVRNGWSWGGINTTLQDEEYGYASWEDHKREKYNEIKLKMTPEEVKERIDTYEYKKLQKMLTEIKPFLDSLTYNTIIHYMNDRIAKDDDMSNHFKHMHNKYLALIDTNLNPVPYNEEMNDLCVRSGVKQKDIRNPELVYILELIMLYRDIVDICLEREYELKLNEIEVKRLEDIIKGNNPQKY